MIWVIAGAIYFIVVAAAILDQLRRIAASSEVAANTLLGLLAARDVQSGSPFARRPPLR